jgi:hypothetical protein
MIKTSGINSHITDGGLCSSPSPGAAFSVVLSVFSKLMTRLHALRVRSKAFGLTMKNRRRRSGPRRLAGLESRQATSSSNAAQRRAAVSELWNELMLDATASRR